MVITYIRGLITPLITTHEPPSKHPNPKPCKSDIPPFHAAEQARDHGPATERELRSQIHGRILGCRVYRGLVFRGFRFSLRRSAGPASRMRNAWQQGQTPGLRCVSLIRPGGSPCGFLQT